MEAIFKHVQTHIGMSHFSRTKFIDALDWVVQSGQASFHQHHMMLVSETDEPSKKKVRITVATQDPYPEKAETTYTITDNDGDVLVVPEPEPEDTYDDIPNEDGKEASVAYRMLTQFHDQSRTYEDIATPGDSTLALGTDQFLYYRGKDSYVYPTNEFRQVRSDVSYADYTGITQVFSNSSTRDYCFTINEDGVLNTYAIYHDSWGRHRVKNNMDIQLLSSYSYSVLLPTTFESGSRHKAIYRHGEWLDRRLCTNRMFVWHSNMFKKTHIFFTFDHKHFRQTVRLPSEQDRPIATCIGRNFAHFVDTQGQLHSLRTNPGDATVTGFIAKQGQLDSDRFHDIAHGVFGTFAIVSRRGNSGRTLMRVVHDLASGAVTQCGPVKDVRGDDDRYLSDCKQVSVGRKFAAVLTHDNKVYVVQKDPQFGTAHYALTEIYDGRGPEITKVSAGQHHLIALDEHGRLWGWGDNGYFQAGDSKAVSAGGVDLSLDGGGLFKFMLRLRLQ